MNPGGASGRSIWYCRPVGQHDVDPVAVRVHPHPYERRRADAPAGRRAAAPVQQRHRAGRVRENPVRRRWRRGESCAPGLDDRQQPRSPEPVASGQDQHGHHGRRSEDVRRRRTGPDASRPRPAASPYGRASSARSASASRSPGIRAPPRSSRRWQQLGAVGRARHGSGSSPCRPSTRAGTRSRPRRGPRRTAGRRPPADAAASLRSAAATRQPRLRAPGLVGDGPVGHGRDRPRHAPAPGGDVLVDHHAAHVRLRVTAGQHPRPVGRRPDQRRLDEVLRRVMVAGQQVGGPGQGHLPRRDELGETEHSDPCEPPSTAHHAAARRRWSSLTRGGIRRRRDPWPGVDARRRPSVTRAQLGR